MNEVSDRQFMMILQVTIGNCRHNIPSLGHHDSAGHLVRSVIVKSRRVIV